MSSPINATCSGFSWILDRTCSKKSMDGLPVITASISQAYSMASTKGPASRKESMGSVSID